MSVKDNEWPEYVKMLSKLTKQRKIKWQASAGPKWKNGSPIPPSYDSEFAERHLRLQEREQSLSSLMGLFPEVAPAQLVIVDEAGNILFVFPDVPEIQDLLAAVKEQMVDLSDFLTQIKAASGNAL